MKFEECPSCHDQFARRLCESCWLREATIEDVSPFGTIPYCHDCYVETGASPLVQDCIVGQGEIILYPLPPPEED